MANPIASFKGFLNQSFLTNFGHSFSDSSIPSESPVCAEIPRACWWADDWISVLIESSACRGLVVGPPAGATSLFDCTHSQMFTVARIRLLSSLERILDKNS